MDEDRLIEIETRLAYQDQALTELNRVLTDQQAQLTRLEALTTALNERLRTLSEPAPVADDDNERPPHY